MVLWVNARFGDVGGPLMLVDCAGRRMLADRDVGWKLGLSWLDCCGSGRSCYFGSALLMDGSKRAFCCGQMGLPVADLLWLGLKAITVCWR
ncbi:hypothetical protein ACLOJK_003123 [Asimina triloba]